MPTGAQRSTNLRAPPIGLRLIGDIGGTNARLAMVDQRHEIVEQTILATADFPGIAEAIAAFLRGRKVADAVLAVATPVDRDRIKLTNCPWSFSITELGRQTGIAHLFVINDFVAQAMAVPHLDAEALELVGGQPGSASTVQPRPPIAVMGPGTGLGVAGLLPTADGWTPIASEGGHVSFAPNDEREDAVLRDLRKTFPHVSNERLISGPGLLHLARSLARVDSKAIDAATPEQVVREARAQRCATSVEAVSMLSALLGAAAGDVALSFGAKSGVYICGGVVGHLGSLLDRGRLHERFLAKGRLRSYLEPIPLFLVTHPQPGLLGAAHFRPPSTR